jgi:hypothetical protein
MKHANRPIAAVSLALIGACLSAVLSGCGESSAPAAPQLTPTAVATSSSDSAKAAAPKPSAIRSVTFDAVKLDLKKGDPYDPKVLTAGVKQLDGNRIRIRGYMFPSAQQSGLKRFVLVRDNQQCCFGPGAALFDSMIVDMTPGSTIDYQLAPIMVEGTFAIRPVELNGKYIAIYHLSAEKAQ